MPPSTAQTTRTAQTNLAERVAAVRDFNRFYTKQIGLLGDGLLRTPHSLTEARVIWELAQRGETEVAELRRSLELDAGYVSRILARFEREGLVARKRSEVDRRRQVVRLTRSGQTAFRTLDRRSAEKLGGVLGEHSDAEQRRLLAAMGAIRAILGGGIEGRVELRAPGPGDHGWVLERHGELYARERGWGPRFETLVAEVVAGFLAGHDPERERCWIAELDGKRAGSIYCTQRSKRVAQIRLLLVEPWARGHGISGRLVDECLEFARDSGYERIMLWTNSRLESARAIYESAGFEQSSEAASEVFDAGSVGQELWLDL